MLSARILIISDRQDVVAELEPLIHAERHLATVVPSGRELLDLLNSGLVPDVVISDTGGSHAHDPSPYLERFRELNRAGCHMVVMETGGEDEIPLPIRERIATLQRPFDRTLVRGQLEGVLREMEREIHATRAEVWRSMDRLRREVDTVRTDMIRALARTIAARDEYMTGHAERVSGLSGEMAVAMGLGGAEVRKLRDAAQLHEIGKISVPVDLLQKKDPLSSEELARIRSHMQTGAEILREVPSLSGVAPLVEHMGTRFCDLQAHISPDSAEGRLIGILRVADVWDAVTSPRSYRPPMPREYAEPLLRDGAGSLFDPGAVSALFQILSPATDP